MCGIIITQTPKALDMIAHRGTEFNKVDLKNGHGWFLGHSRLPIQTLPGPDDPGVQPVKLPDGGYLLYNGEIYNYPSGYKSDTEYLKDLLSKGYSVYQMLDAAKNWDGMWTIVRTTSTGYWAFTDPLGKKQFYYNDKGEGCSEIVPLVHNYKQFDPLYRSETFKWGYNMDNRTPFEGVRRLLPGEVLTCRFGYGAWAEEKNWYSWDVLPFDGNLKDASLMLKAMLYQSVTLRSRSAREEPVGVLLSGGLDSSVITTILAKQGIDMRLYSVDGEEAEYVRLLTQRLGIEDKVTWLPANTNERYSDEEIKEVLRWNESPIDLGSLMPQHRLCSAVESDIILTGDGSDELFGGYRRIHDYDSQRSDVFQELPFYHLPRLDRAAMRFTKELRSPFLSQDIVKFALSLPYEFRIDKLVLKEAFRGSIPDEILDRPKQPLKSAALKDDPLAWRKHLHTLFYGDLYKNR